MRGYLQRSFLLYLLYAGHMIPPHKLVMCKQVGMVLLFKLIYYHDIHCWVLSLSIKRGASVMVMDTILITNTFLFMFIA